MPGNPLFPSAVEPERVPLIGCASATPGEGLVGWEYTTSQAVDFRTSAAESQPIVMLSAPDAPGFNAWRQGPGAGACRDAVAPVNQWWDRVAVWLWSWDQTSVGKIVELSLLCGFDRQGEEQFRGSLILGQGGMTHFATVAGLPMGHFQIRGRVTLEAAVSANFAVRIYFDRSGSQFQLRWGPAVTKIVPATAGTLP